MGGLKRREEERRGEKRRGKEKKGRNEVIIVEYQKEKKKIRSSYTE